MADAQGIKSLKITGRNQVRILPADWVAGVDYDDHDSDNPDDDNNEDYHDENADDEIREDQFEPITQEEIDDLNAGDAQQIQPNPSDSDNQPAVSENQNEEPDIDGARGNNDEPVSYTHLTLPTIA